RPSVVDDRRASSILEPVAAVLWVDFGVVTEPGDVLGRLLTDLAPETWSDASARVDRNEVTREQALTTTLSRVQLSTEEIAAATRAIATPAQDFLELHDWGHWHGWSAVVVGLVPDVVMDT